MRSDIPTPDGESSTFFCMCTGCADIFYSGEDVELCPKCASTQRDDTVPSGPPTWDIVESSGGGERVGGILPGAMMWIEEETI